LIGDSAPILHGVRRGIEQDTLGCGGRAVILRLEESGIVAGQRSNGRYRIKKKRLKEQRRQQKSKSK